MSKLTRRSAPNMNILTQRLLNFWLRCVPAHGGLQIITLCLRGYGEFGASMNTPMDGAREMI